MHQLNHIGSSRVGGSGANVAHHFLVAFDGTHVTQDIVNQGYFLVGYAIGDFWGVPATPVVVFLEEAKGGQEETDSKQGSGLIGVGASNGVTSGVLDVEPEEEGV